ncbi:hypothetical protein A1O3_02016 [Capronia epimyces CBS 606.96]|uniref:Cytochrome b5 heme-binding domain-containing protein n=1 Tax=Capronia epimyces CBS 606.96 TaxID=1182542 RepID=W9Y7Y7_9EURO|nr:uncharacterized protein A1O3_02016 [Capronia epimyces CBS 606.96]EXJ88952.1 hypothetical protein A1O3_02016 [Capronia epimyces CBS 606.96]
MKQFSLAEVARHAQRDDLYIIYQSQVYEVTNFLSEHPGGEDVILELAGKDATEAFDEVGHSEDAQNQLHELLIGSLDQQSSATLATKKKATTGTTKTTSVPFSPVTLGGLVIAAAAAVWVYTQKK